MNSANGLAAIILAAGKGKRMKSDLPKVLHKVGENPMVVHVIHQARLAGADKIVVVLGHKRELVIPVVEAEGAEFAIQDEQLGTGHAVDITEAQLKSFQGDIIVLSGDVPLLTPETIKNVYAYHAKQDATATVITAIAHDPTGYGRVLRDDSGAVRAIREHKDCSEEELKVNEINSGIYVFKAKPLFKELKNIDNKNSQDEYYLPDVLVNYIRNGVKVAAFSGDFDEIHGVNNVVDLENVQRIFSQRQNRA
ncbi:NTP transferase domain-containing protein [bacterium]|nr:NTP transferase domain-containing protein [bacterium]